MAIVEFDERAALREDRWVSFCAQHAEAYAGAEPFPHIVIDGLLPEARIDEIRAEFPALDAMRVKSNRTTGVKGSLAEAGQWGTVTRDTIGWLNSAAFLRGLVALTGIEGLASDPYFEGGGLHQIGEGGFLKIHADFNIHKVTGMERRINLLLYLNRDWPEDFGGHLELWDEAMEHRVQRIAPLANRCVIFSTTDTSYHGHPDPLTCGPGESRKSIALYYYTAPKAQKEFHSTLYQARPFEDLEKKKKKKKKLWGLLRA